MTFEHRRRRYRFRRRRRPPHADGRFGVDGGHHGDATVEAAVPDLLENGVAGQVGHPPVQQHHVDRRVQRLERRRPVDRGPNHVPVPKPRRVQVGERALVVHDQHRRVALVCHGEPRRSKWLFQI
jgi:hypothetical protein